MMKNRPLSPHLIIYKPQLTSVMSISHRLCGIALAKGCILAAAWVIALASGPMYFAFVQAIMLSLPGQLILFGFSVAVFYHLSNGVRHLIWDTGRCLSLRGVYVSGYMVMASTLILTGGLWFIVIRN